MSNRATVPGGASDLLILVEVEASGSYAPTQS